MYKTRWIHCYSPVFIDVEYSNWPYAQSTLLWPPFFTNGLQVADIAFWESVIWKVGTDLAELCLSIRSIMTTFWPIVLKKRFFTLKIKRLNSGVFYKAVRRWKSFYCRILALFILMGNMNHIGKNICLSYKLHKGNECLI